MTRKSSDGAKGGDGDARSNSSDNNGEGGRSHYRADNSGGFGNPPVKGQFQPGNKGGPGRPKGSLSIDKALEKAFRKRGKVKDRGELRSLPVTTVLADKVVEHGLRGSPQATLAVLELAKKYGPNEADEAKAEDEWFTKRMWDRLNLEEARMLNYLFDRIYAPKEPKRELPGFYVTKVTNDGVHHEYCSALPNHPDVVIKIENRAYFRACRERPLIFDRTRR